MQLRVVADRADDSILQACFVVRNCGFWLLAYCQTLTVLNSQLCEKCSLDFSHEKQRALLVLKLFLSSC